MNTQMLFVLLVLLCHGICVAQGSNTDNHPKLVVDADGFAGGNISHLRISADGRFLAAAAGKVVRVWDLRTFELWCTLRGYQERQGHHIGFIDSLSFSHDGKRLSVGVSDNVAVGSTREYNLLDPDELELIEGQGGCTREVAYSANGLYKSTFG